MDDSREKAALQKLQTDIEEKDVEMIFLKRKLDHDIGYNYWKKYVSSAFWAQISTPINLIITFLTAITTAQAQSQDVISKELYSQLAIVSLIITTLNTFFRPHQQYANNTEYLGKWNDIGVRFDKEYCDKVNTKIITDASLKKVIAKVTEYKKIQDEVINLRKIEGAGTINFVTDLIFLICYNTCIRNKRLWLAPDRKIEKEANKKKSSALPSKVPFGQLAVRDPPSNVQITVGSARSETPPPPPPPAESRN